MYKNIFFNRDCTCSPIISQAIHQLESVKIDRSFLFMAMYSDGLAKALKQIKGFYLNFSITFWN